MTKPSALQVGGKKAKGRTNKATKTHKRKSMSKKMRHTKKHHKGGRVLKKKTDAKDLKKIITATEHDNNGALIQQKLKDIDPRLVEPNKVSFDRRFTWLTGIYGQHKDYDEKTGKIPSIREILVEEIQGMIANQDELYKVIMSPKNNRDVEIKLYEQTYQNIEDALLVLRSKPKFVRNLFIDELENLVNNESQGWAKKNYKSFGYTTLNTRAKVDEFRKFLDLDGFSLLHSNPLSKYQKEHKANFSKWFFGLIKDKKLYYEPKLEVSAPTKVSPETNETNESSSSYSIKKLFNMTGSNKPTISTEPFKITMKDYADAKKVPITQLETTNLYRLSITILIKDRVGAGLSVAKYLTGKEIEKLE